MDLGFGELVVVFLVIVLLFGGSRLPALGEGLGKAIRGLKEGLRGEPDPKGDEQSGSNPGSRHEG